MPRPRPDLSAEDFINGAEATTAATNKKANAQAPKKAPKKTPKKAGVVRLTLEREADVNIDELPWLDDYVRQNPGVVRSQPVRMPVALKHKLEFVSKLGYGSQNGIMCELLEKHLDEILKKHGLPLD